MIARQFLPRLGSPGYHLMLGAVAIFILGPLGGITAAYMNFALGFFVGGQVLAGILGSAVTYGYGAEGKHGANYMQTMAASVAGLSGMAVLIQAMRWLGLPEPPTWQLILYFTAIGMLGVGVGMFYTPLLVDRMQLPYPSGYAVANILRALTDPRILRRSIAQLGSGTGLGFLLGLSATAAGKMQSALGWGEAHAGLANRALGWLQSPGISTATVGAGMVVGARIAIPALLVGSIGLALTPYLREMGLLGPQDPFRKIGFVAALGMILGAALVDLAFIGFQAVRRYRERAGHPPESVEDWKRVNTFQLFLWIIFWAVVVYLTATQLLNQPPRFVLLALFLVFVFVLINGISFGISDSNPISSAFVIAVFLMALMGLDDPGSGLLCAAILLISCSIGGDMQQDRSTGWRLGTNRINQFRYQVLGVVMGACMAVALAHLFMKAYPVLSVDTFTYPQTEGAEQWQSAMTYKFVGALKGLTNPSPFFVKALLLGIGLGAVIEVLRKSIRMSPAYLRYRETKSGKVVDFLLDAVVIPSPYASSFGGFVDFMTSVWFTLGGVTGSVWDYWNKRQHARRTASESDLPADMSVVSLVGGGLIGGDSLAALAIGLYGLISTLM